MFPQGNPDPLCLINEMQVSKIFHFSKMTEELNQTNFIRISYVSIYVDLMSLEEVLDDCQSFRFKTNHG